MGIRTPDLYVANVSRYQLCYIPVWALTQKEMRQRVFWWEQQNSNLRPFACQANALTN